MNNIIEIKDLYKNYGTLKAVQDLSFCVKEGELFAFLGVNGAGKSTTINIMCGQLSKNSGTVLIDGIDIDKDLNSSKCKMGVVFQNSVLDAPLSVYDNLESRASLYGITGDKFKERLDELAKLLDFDSFIHQQVSKLSGGQKRRIDIARALLHKPKILVLDEPTTGLDPQTRKLLWDVVTDLRKNEHMTVFLTTHYMEEAADADYVVIIDSGKVATKGTPLELKNTFVKDYLIIYNTEEEQIKLLGYEYEKIRDAYKVFVPNTMDAKNLIIKYPNIFKDFELIKGKMDDVFLTVTGKKLTGGSDND